MDEAQQKHEAAMLLGRLGGRAGRGESKRRPLTTERARAMAAAKKSKPKCGFCGMRLPHKDFDNCPHCRASFSFSKPK